MLSIKSVYLLTYLLTYNIWLGRRVEFVKRLTERFPLQVVGRLLAGPSTQDDGDDEGSSSLSEDCPLLVHCGTGVSRTGVFIAVDYSLMKAKQENCINLYRSLPHCIPL